MFRWNKSGKNATKSDVGRTASDVGRCALTPPDPQLKGAWFQPLRLSSENPVSKCAFQMQFPRLHRGARGRRGAREEAMMKGKNYAVDADVYNIKTRTVLFLLFAFVALLLKHTPARRENYLRRNAGGILMPSFSQPESVIWRPCEVMFGASLSAAASRRSRPDADSSAAAVGSFPYACDVLATASEFISGATPSTLLARAPHPDVDI
jgi:hypothetical protein